MSTELLDLARQIAIEAGDLASLRRAEGVEIADLKSSAVDIVTHADRETEVLIRRAARQGASGRRLPRRGGRRRAGHQRPHLGRRSDRRHRQLPVRHPALRRQHRGRRGRPRPAHLARARRLRRQPGDRRGVLGHVPGVAPTSARAGWRSHPRCTRSQALIATGFGYSAERRAEQGAVVAGLLGRRCATSAASGTASLDLCFVAAGRVNAYYERGLNPWDHAAGALIARRGGRRRCPGGAARPRITSSSWPPNRSWPRPCNLSSTRWAPKENSTGTAAG